MPEINSFRSLHIIIILGIVVFGFCLFNGFIGDDTGYILHPYIQQFEIFKLVSGGSTDLGGSSPITSQFYRPLMLIHFAGIAHFFGTAAFPYHFVQMFLHSTNAVLLFFFFKKFFTAPLSCFLSVVFLVHPINSETVAHISNLQDVLFVFFGLLAMHILSVTQRTWKIYLMVGVLLLLALLSKETGVLFLFMVPLYEYLFLQKNKYIFLPVIVSVLVYGCMRFIVAGVGVGKSPDSLLSTLSVWGRLQHLPAIVNYYFTTFVFPVNISLGQTWIIKELSFETFYVPLVVLLLVFSAIIALGFALKKSKAKLFSVYLFFCSWLLLGLLPHLQLLPLEMTVATRWFYFPIIGLLGICGIALSVFFKTNKYPTLLFILSILVISLLSFVTISRLLLWKDAITLYQHDTQQTESYMLEHALGFELLQQKQLDDAYKHFKKSIELFPTAVNTNSLGVYYYQKKDIVQAKKWFYTSNTYGDSYLAYQNLSRILLQYDSPTVAKNYIEGAVKKFPQSSTLWHLLSLASYKSGDTDRAMTAAVKAYEILPIREHEYVLTQLQRGEKLDIR